MRETAILLIDCPDRKGLVAAIADFLYRHGANILHSDQHQDNEAGLFFMRNEWDLAGFDLDKREFQKQFQPIADRFQMRWRLEYSSVRTVAVILVSKYTHCLADLLYRRQAGEFQCDIPAIISNHEDAKPLANFYGVPFHYLPISTENKPEVEAAQLKIIQKHGANLIVLARYMQVLSPTFVRQYPQRIINVHHSFLPAFAGARPYHAAFERGVKLIGATSHYVTAVLDDGPIIEQDVVRISHRDQLEDLIQKGKDLERSVLCRAVRWHLEHRILAYANKTVVFD